MLKPDELLPEEWTTPGLIQALQTHFQLKPAEQQTLQRVQQRLAEHVAPLPLETGAAQSQPQTHPQRLSPQITQPRSLRHSRLGMLAAVLLVGLLVGAFVWTLAATNRISSNSAPATGSTAKDVQIVLLPAKQNQALSSLAISSMRSLLAQRFSSFGLVGSSVHTQLTNGQPSFLVRLPDFSGNKQQIINPLLAPGVIQFWNTGPDVLTAGSSFDPARYATYNPGGLPAFTNKDLDPGSLEVVQNTITRAPAISFAMQGVASQRFQTFTARNIGNALTITLDGKVLESADIQSAISGPGLIEDNFTLQQAKALVAVLKHGSLPFKLKTLS